MPSEASNSWVLSRVGTRLFTALIGSALGWWAGDWFNHPILLAITGAALAVLGLSVVDTLKGHRLLDWLRTPEAPAPALPGLWGEVAHRIERVLRQRERLLAEERRRLDALLSGIQASPNGVILLDANDQISWISTVAAQHFGLDPVRDIQQRVTNLIRQPAFVQYLQAGDYREPVKCPMPFGGLGFLSVQLSRYGEGLKLLLSQDITERERSDRMRRDFVANVSHEIRTPLTVLSGFIESLASLSLSEPERQRVITLMTQQAERMQSLVADLLTLAQIEASPRPAADRWIKVSDLMARVESEGRGLSRGQHPMTFGIDDAGGEPQIAGEEREWLSAMSNLVSNAVRYTPSGSAIDVRWTRAPDGGAEFAVRDFGIGIAAEHLPRLSERFYRIDGSRSRETGGTGLGLSIVKHVVQRHGGALRITSTLGKGSTFSISLPAVRVRNGRAAASS